MPVVAGHEVRPLRVEDAGPAAAVHRALQESLGYRPSATCTELQEWWRRCDLESDSWALEEGGALLGLAWVTVDEGIARASGFVAPSAAGRGLGRALVDLAEQRSGALGAAAVHQHAYEADAAAAALLESRGYAVVRRFYEMEVELDAPPPAPSWPSGVSPSPFRPEDARAFYDTVGAAFADEWGFVSMPFEEWRRLRVEEADTSLYFLAREGDEVAGVIRCETGVRDCGWVGVLGVRAGWRGRGIGKALLLHALHAFHDRGERRVGLGVDAQNATGALRLYEGVGMTVQMAAVVYEKPLG